MQDLQLVAGREDGLDVCTIFSQADFPTTMVTGRLDAQFKVPDLHQWCLTGDVQVRSADDGEYSVQGFRNADHIRAEADIESNKHACERRIGFQRSLIL